MPKRQEMISENILLQHMMLFHIIMGTWHLDMTTFFPVTFAHFVVNGSLKYSKQPSEQEVCPFFFFLPQILISFPCIPFKVQHPYEFKANKLGFFRFFISPRSARQLLPAAVRPGGPFVHPAGTAGSSETLRADFLMKPSFVVVVVVLCF